MCSEESTSDSILQILNYFQQLDLSFKSDVTSETQCTVYTGSTARQKSELFCQNYIFFITKLQNNVKIIFFIFYQDKIVKKSISIQPASDDFTMFHKHIICKLGTYSIVLNDHTLRQHSVTFYQSIHLFINFCLSWGLSYGDSYLSKEAQTSICLATSVSSLLSLTESQLPIAHDHR